LPVLGATIPNCLFFHRSGKGSFTPQPRGFLQKQQQKHAAFVNRQSSVGSRC
jgi:hypothetical protein